MLDRNTTSSAGGEHGKIDRTMSLARAFTKRGKRPVISSPNISSPSSAPLRAVSVRRPPGSPIKRDQISGPLELISTTNVLAYNAPDIYSPVSSPVVKSSSSVISSDSGNDSDTSPAFSSSSSMTQTDASSVESSPMEPNHFSSYFNGTSIPETSHEDLKRDSSDHVQAPSIPARALSHTRKSHEAMARKRSLRQSPPPSITSSLANISRSSVEMFSGAIEANHPFGAELEQVNELAEDFAARDVIILDEEEQFIFDQGLRKFNAADYLVEIEGLFKGMQEDDIYGSYQAAWI